MPLLWQNFLIQNPRKSSKDCSNTRVHTSFWMFF